MYRWTLADVVLVVVFLAAMFGVGVMVKTMHVVELMATQGNVNDISVKGSPP